MKKVMMMESAIGFIHIPKTGGSSFNSALRRVLGEKISLVSVFDFANFGDHLQEIPVISGHIPFFIYDAESTRRRLFTALRHPEERVISNYNYILASEAHYAHTYVKRRHLSIAQCFDHPVLRIEITNFQTKMLGWTPQRKITWPAHGSEKLGSFFAEYNGFLYGEANNDTLVTAMGRLSQRIAFGLSEDQHSLVRLCQAITGSDPGEIPRENKTPLTDYDVTPADLDAIRQNNLLDHALVEFAKGILTSARSQPGD